MRLYHTGFDVIREPDVHHGRKNADLGQGFYMTRDLAFAERWGMFRKGLQTVVNEYELDLSGLTVHTFDRDEAWLDYLAGNRGGKKDTLDADVVIGPIANDTIYDTLGIMTSGFLGKAEALKLLKLGPEYEQIVLKTEKAAAQLKFISSKVLEEAFLQENARRIRAEEEAYQKACAGEMESWADA